MNLLKEYCRMCVSIGCSEDCPITDASGDMHCKEWILNNFDQAAEIITEWAQEHPEKTRQDVFLEQHPMAMVNDDNFICICPHLMDRRIDCRVVRSNYTESCVNCTREYWLAPAEEE